MPAQARLSLVVSLNNGRLVDTIHMSPDRERDLLIERAENLVSVARTNAKAMFTPLLKRFPILRPVKLEHWDFILTVAGVFIAATRLNNLHLEEAREDSLMEVVAERLDRSRPTRHTRPTLGLGVIMSESGASPSAAELVR